MEYVAEGLERVNDINGKRIILYLARYGDEERTRDQIKADLKLELSDKELADKLFMLEQADLIAPGSSNFRFKGLGDPIFEVIFRKCFAEEIENVDTARVSREFEEDMKKLKRQLAWHKGTAGEYRVMFYLQQAIQKGRDAGEIMFEPVPGFCLANLAHLGKKTFHIDQTNSRIVDMFGKSSREDGMDLIVEVKTWESTISTEAVQNFLAMKQDIEPQLQRPTAFLLYSEQGFTPEQEKLMRDNQIMWTTHAKLIKNL